MIIPGKLCQRRGEKGKITGWKLQRWQKGHNQTRYIPAGLTERIQEGTAGCERFMALAHEYTEVKGEEALADLSAPQHAKKKPMKR